MILKVKKESKMIKLFKYKLDDKTNAIKALIETYVQPPWEEKWTEDRVEKRIEYFTTGKASLSYRIDNDGVTVGFIFGRKEIIAQKDIFYLDELFIHPDYQRKGYGRLALNCLEKELLSIGISSIELHTIKEDVGFYTKVGYKRSELILFEKKIK